MPNNIPAVVRTDPGAWQAVHLYAGSSIVRPTTPNGLQYHSNIITPGTSAGAEPTWPLIIGNTVIDGTVTWTCSSELPLYPGLPDITVPVNGDTGVPQAVLAGQVQLDNWIASIWKNVNTDLATNSNFPGQTGSSPACAVVGSVLAGATPSAPITFVTPTTGTKFTTQTFQVSFTSAVLATSALVVTGVQLPFALANFNHAQIAASLTFVAFDGIFLEQTSLTGNSACSFILYNTTGSSTGSKSFHVTITVSGGDA